MKTPETFSGQLSKYTDTTVYNYGISGGSPKEALYLLRYYLNLKSIKNPEYVIFTYIEDQINRINQYGWVIDNEEMPVFIKKSDNTLEYNNKRKKIYKSKTFLYLNHVYSEHQSVKCKDLLNLYFTEINKEIKKNFPDCKFVILVYTETGIEDWEPLKKENIEIIHLKDLADINPNDAEYCISKEDVHPNAKVWEKIVPPLAKKLNLK